jgi:hypothetical protein
MTTDTSVAHPQRSDHHGVDDTIPDDWVDFDDGASNSTVDSDLNPFALRRKAKTASMSPLSVNRQNVTDNF